MLDWSVQRQAMWFYHNQSLAQNAAYQQQLAQNAQLQAEVNRLRAANTPVDSNYVDSEFKDNPDLMYSDEYVQAAYNPAGAAPSSVSGKAVLWTLVILLVIGGGVYLVFFHNFKTNNS